MEPIHDLIARSTATSAAEGRMKVDAGRKRKVLRKTVRKYIKKGRR